MVSIIIPAYNCADFVTETAESVLAQTYSELELIFVNDGSTDNTLLVLEELKSADSRVKIITKKNAGPAAARNVGIENASGEYIWFIDSDDIIEKTALADFVLKAQADRLDVVCCGYKAQRLKDGRLCSLGNFSHENITCLTHEEFMKSLVSLIKAHVMYAVWNKFYRLEFLKKNNIKFENYMSGEDRLFNIRSFEYITRFAFIDRQNYNYLTRGSASLAGRFVADKPQTAILCYNELLSACKSASPADKQALNSEFVKNVLACITQLFSKSCPLSYSQKRSYTSNILTTPTIFESTAAAGTGLLKFINPVLHSKNITLTMLICRFIYFAQTRLAPLFFKLKQNG